MFSLLGIDPTEGMEQTEREDTANAQQSHTSAGRCEQL